MGTFNSKRALDRDSRCDLRHDKHGPKRPLPRIRPAGGGPKAPLVYIAIAMCVAACAITAPPPNNAAALQDIAAGHSGAELVVEGTVVRVLPTSPGPSGIHERFVVNVASASTSVPLFVADNISVGSAAPLHVGDRVIVKGELAFNRFGPVLHWTHRDPRTRHAPGFVEVGGHLYE